MPCGCKKGHGIQIRGGGMQLRGGGYKKRRRRRRKKKGSGWRGFARGAAHFGQSLLDPVGFLGGSLVRGRVGGRLGNAGGRVGNAARRMGSKRGSAVRTKFLSGATWHRGSGMSMTGAGMNIVGSGIRGKRVLVRRGTGRRVI